MVLTRYLLRHSINFVNKSHPRFNYSTLAKSLIMGDSEKPGYSLQVVMKHLEEFASSKTAEPWDNTGLLIDPMDPSPIRKILVTNDLTEDVMKEAIELKVGMILSYHPPIFKGLMTLTSNTWKERIVIQCLKHSMAVYSPHTAWDNKENGPNNWIAECLNPSSTEPILESGTGRLCKLKEPLTVLNAIEKIKHHIQIPHLRLALAVGKTTDSKISTVAVCVGSGSSVLAGIKADLFLTGEMLHHDVLDATHNGSHVVLCNHSDSERGYLRTITPHLQNQLLSGMVDVIMSQQDKDPLTTV